MPQSVAQVNAAAQAGLERAQCNISSHEFDPALGGTIEATSANGFDATVSFNSQANGTSLKVTTAGSEPAACVAEAERLLASIQDVLDAE